MHSRYMHSHYMYSHYMHSHYMHSHYMHSHYIHSHYMHSHYNTATRAPIPGSAQRWVGCIHDSTQRCQSVQISRTQSGNREALPEPIGGPATFRILWLDSTLTDPSLGG